MEEKKAVLKKLKALLVFVIAIIAGILYRMGGSGNFPRQCRLIGVPLVSTALLALLGGFNWWMLLCIPLMIGAISTYWKKKGTDATFINYFLHGVGIAIAMLPYAIATHLYIGFAIRCVCLPLLVAFWATKMNRPILWWQADVASEFGRGFFIAATIPLLLI